MTEQEANAQEANDKMAQAMLAGARVLRDTINQPNQAVRAKRVFDAMNKALGVAAA